MEKQQEIIRIAEVSEQLRGLCERSLSHGYRTDTKNISAVSKYFTTMPYRLDEVSLLPSWLSPRWQVPAVPA